MLNIRTGILTIYLFILVAGLCAVEGKTEGKTVGKEPATSGYMDIIVESNINRLSFTYDLTAVNLQNIEEPAGESASRYTSIVIPVRDFRCENKTALNDFLTLLKADRYPVLAINIPYSMIFQPVNKDSMLLNDLTATIAGITKKYDIVCTIDNTFPDDCMLSGTLKIMLSDLGIEPPVKYFGLVKVKNEVIVKFGVHLKNACSFALKN